MLMHCWRHMLLYHLRVGLLMLLLLLYRHLLIGALGLGRRLRGRRDGLSGGLWEGRRLLLLLLLGDWQGRRRLVALKRLLGSAADNLLIPLVALLNESLLLLLVRLILSLGILH